MAENISKKTNPSRVLLDFVHLQLIH